MRSIESSADDLDSGDDVHPDGNRFVMVEGGVSGAFPDEIHVVLNWHEELKRLVPTGE